MATLTTINQLAVCYSIDYNNSRRRVEEEAARPMSNPRRWNHASTTRYLGNVLCREPNLLGLSGDELNRCSCVRAMRSCLGKFTLEMGDHYWLTSGLQRLRTCAAPAYRLARTEEERNELRMGFATD